MRDLADLLMFLAAVFIPVLISIFLIEAALRSRKLESVRTAVVEGLNQVRVRLGIRRGAQFRVTAGLAGAPSNHEALNAFNSRLSEEQRALFLHDVEFGTNRGLLVTFDGDVYVTRQHRKQIDRYMRRSGREGAMKVFSQHGYRLFTSRRS